MKSIVFFTGDITRSGGTEKVSAIIANELVRTGKYHISFVSIVEQNPCPHFPISSKIRRFTLKKDGKWVPPGPGYLPLIPGLRGFLKKKKPDIIIDVDLVLDILAIPASLGLPVKVVSWEHFHYLFEQKSCYRRIIARFTACFSDYIVTLTPQDRENYREKLGRRRGITYIYNPLILSDAAENRICEPDSALPEREKIIVTVGRLDRIKGTDMLARIIPEILCTHRDWKWYFLGGGDCREMLEQVCGKYGLEDRLILTGVVSDIENYLKRASLCVLASRTESFGMCILEAKAWGVPCICFDVPYGPSVIIRDGVDGFLVPPFDLKQMKEKIMLLMEDEALRNRFFGNTALGLERFRPEPILAKWERLIEKLTTEGETRKRIPGKGGVGKR